MRCPVGDTQYPLGRFRGGLLMVSIVGDAKFAIIPTDGELHLGISIWACG